VKHLSFKELNKLKQSLEKRLAEINSRDDIRPAGRAGVRRIHYHDTREQIRHELAEIRKEMLKRHDEEEVHAKAKRMQKKKSVKESINIPKHIEEEEFDENTPLYCDEKGRSIPNSEIKVGQIVWDGQGNELGTIVTKRGGIGLWKKNEDAMEILNFSDYMMNEEYDPKKHDAFNIVRNLHSSSGTKKFLHIMSLLDDLVHLDFKNIRNTYKNRAGYDKVSDMVGELTLAMQVLKEEGDRAEFALFYDMQRYEIDVDKILDTLEDEGVKKYLDSDVRGRKRIVEDNAELIALLKRYRKWLGGKLEESAKPSEGLSKKKKSSIVKKAKKGENIGKGHFKEVADKAAKKYGSAEKGKKVAAAAMWKNINR